MPTKKQSIVRDELAIARRKKRLQQMRESLDDLAEMYENSKRKKAEIHLLGEIARLMACLRPSLVLDLFEKSKKVPLSKGPARNLNRLARQAERMRDAQYRTHGQFDRAWGQLVLDVDAVYPGTMRKFLSAAKRLELPNPNPAEMIFE